MAPGPGQSLHPRRLCRATTCNTCVPAVAQPRPPPAPATRRDVAPSRQAPAFAGLGGWGISLCGPPAGRHLSKADTSRAPRSPVVHTGGWAPRRHRAHATSPPSWPRLTQPERDGSLHPVSQASLQVETDPASATFLIFENSTTDKSADGDRYLYIKQPRTSKRSLW